MNRKNVGKVLAAFARPGSRERFDLVALIHRVGDATAGPGESVMMFLQLGREDYEALLSDPARYDRDASAAMIQHLFETGAVDWPLAVARAGLKVAA